jgi:diadenosine tetraphosphate (Ap4A) HIT family hydrolase/CTP:molybdopterin cytidylyltransferase MocA
MRELAVVILAAGKGTRMPPDMPKVLRPVAGEPLLAHALRTARALAPARLVTVLGHGAEEVRRAVGLGDAEVVLQLEQRGTGDAVMCAEQQMAGFSGDLLVLYGDVPLLRAETLAGLLEIHCIEENAATILTAGFTDPTGYGRIVRDERGFCVGIVEQRDLAPCQEAIREVNSGIIAFAAARLFPALHDVQPDNRQGEYYLTSVIDLLHRAGERIGTVHLEDEREILGVNTLEELREAERAHIARARAGDAACALCAAQAGAPPRGQPAGGAPTLVLVAGEHVCLKVADPPFNNGHLVLFPRRHVTSLLTLTPEERAELGGWLGRVEEALRRTYSFDAINLGYNSGAGGHLAFHVVPRWQGDVNFLPLLAGLKLVPERPERSWERLREVLE